MRRTVKIVKNSTSAKDNKFVYRVTIPKKQMDILKKLGWDEGTELKASVVDETLIFKKN